MFEKLNPFRLFKQWRQGRGRKPATNLSEAFRLKYQHFKELLASNAELSKIITDIEEKLQGHHIFGMSYVRSQTARAAFHTLRMIESLDALSGRRYGSLFAVLERINGSIKHELGKRKESARTEWILPYSQLTKEMVDWVGGKNANLGEVMNRVNLPIPEGFAITTRAFEHFLLANDLIDELNRLKMELDPDNPDTVQAVSEDVQKAILSAPVPLELQNAILYAYDVMRETIRFNAPDAGASLQVSMRSSAIGEDSELSYAGQYLSVLNVSRDRLVQTYKYIIASLFTPRAISYRLNKGIRDEDIAMSVACLQMIDSVASGVVYSRHPFRVAEDHVLVSGIWGLGPYVVDGVVTPDSYTVARDEARTILETTIASKPVQLVSNPEGGLMERSVPQEKQNQACLRPDQVQILADYALRLEKHYGCAQDMEWALDRTGRLLVLQARPLRIETQDETGTAVLSLPKLENYPLLIEGGAAAFPGIGYGTAHQVASEEDLADFPEGGVLIAKHSSPKFVIVMQKARAILTDSGSVTGHMASLAREFQIPTLLDTKRATATIPTGTEITVDAYSGRVYQGKAVELLSLQTSRGAYMKDTPVYETLQRIAEWIVPLRLIDPKSPDFTPERCNSLHDIMRFVHELSYTEMFQISDLVSDGEGCAVKVVAPIPLDLYAIDIGGGLEGVTEKTRKVKVNQVRSTPFKALLKGMLHEDLRYLKPRPVALKGFFSVMGEQMLSTPPQGAERFGDRSYAIVSDKYLNFSSRVGYHYSILDSYCGQTMSKNYITFCFKGGAADDVRRNRRARAIAAILKALDFSVDVAADRADARIQKYESEVIEDKLDQIGRLLQFTRQMDMLMENEASVAFIARSFLEGNYHLEKAE